jgi:hypothetical protein
MGGGLPYAARRIRMENIKVTTFSQYMNWFRLSISDGALYKIPVTEDSEPTEYFLRHNEGDAVDFYTLEPNDDYPPVYPQGTLRRRVVLRAFRDKLKNIGFKFKGSFGDIAYWDRKATRQPHNDVFSAYTAAFEFRVVEYNTGEDDECFLVIDPHVVFIMNMSVRDLVSRNISLSKLSSLSVRVTAEEGDDHGGIDGFLIETLNGQEGVRCRITDSRTGEEKTVQADHVFIEPRPEVIRSILQALGSNFDVVEFQREKSFLSSPFASRERFEKTQEILRDYLINQVRVFPLTVGEFRIDIASSPVPVVGAGFPQMRQLPEPTLLFDKADSSATHLQAYWGLRTFGSYSKNIPSIKLALMGSRNGVSVLDNLVKQMDRSSSMMPGGMRQFFNTHLVVVDKEVIASESLDGYTQAAETLGARSEMNRNVDVVLVHLPKRTADFDLNTPYYNVKPLLLGYGLPSQMITQPSLSNSQWIHANLASAIFAKAGGHPWVLADDIPEFDMILGVALSQAISKTKRAGGHPRYIGHANVFDRLGRWMFFETSHEQYQADSHEQQLADLIASAVDRYEKVRGGKPRSVAIHYYKRFGQKEMDLIKRVLASKIEDSRVAFIAVDNSHPMRLYDMHIRDGSFPRANYVVLSENEFLLSTTGHTDLAKKRLGTPLILKVTIDQSPEGFVTLESVANQVLALTRLNYKTLTPVVGEPVTLRFANLVANFAAVFSEHQWKDAQASAKGSKLNTRPWFL